MDAPLWSTGDKTAFIFHDELTHINGMKPVDILGGIENPDDLFLVDVRRRRRLNQNPMNGGILIKFADHPENLFLGRFPRQLDPA